MRKFGLKFVLGVLLLLFLFPLRTRAAAQDSTAALRPHEKQFFPIGVWDNIPLNRFGELRRAGFNIIVAGGPGNVGLNQAILDSAGAHDVKVFLMATWCEYYCAPVSRLDADSVILGRLAVDLYNYSRFPSFYGWYLRDEPGEGEIDRLAYVQGLARRADPIRPKLINLYPVSISYIKDSPVTDYRQFLRSFTDKLMPDMICFDFYPFQTGSTSLDRLEENLSLVRNESVRTGTPFWYITQSSGWQRSVPVGLEFEWKDVLRVPNEVEMRTAVGLALVYGAKGILYFRYTPCKEGNVRFTGMVDSRETDDQKLRFTEDGYFPEKFSFFNAGEELLWPNPTYFRVKLINNWLLKLSPVLSRLDSKALFRLSEEGTPAAKGSTSPVQSGLVTGEARYRTSGTVAVKLDKGEVTVGEFRDGGKIVMGAVNKTLTKTSAITAAFKGKSGRLIDLYSGKEIKLKESGDKDFPLYFKLQLDPGETRFFRVDVS
ncbi:MAG: beta-galactosidase [Candidatus Eisenbacteria bacterium]|nr:beta-galactosidase [Candidatus Eisenbacteria bacterium]